MLPFAEITALRLRMLETGYTPVPVNGKIPPLSAWQTTPVSADSVKKWEADFDKAHNTGATCRNMPTLDIDVKNPDAAAAAEEIIRKHFEERGKILVRTGEAPKRAVLFRTNTPFSKK